MKKITHEDVIFFNTKEQLHEYMELSGDTDFFDIEIHNIFPQIQSKHWSFCVTEQYEHNMWDLKKSALDRLISYECYKKNNLCA